MTQQGETSATAAGQPRLFVALDTADLAAARTLAARLDRPNLGLKLGKEFFAAQGPAGVRAVAEGRPLFLDLKFHDIPNTVVGAVRAAAALAPGLLNVHASGGPAMLRAAAAAATEGAEAAGVPRPAVLAVTVLTSLDDDDLAAVGQRPPVAAQVARLAGLAADCGLDGVVCGAGELPALRAAQGAGFRLVVPGIRPTWAARDDQKRAMTPAEAVAAGADAIVVGRPVTGAADPAAAAAAILEEIAAAETPGAGGRP